MDSTNQLPTTLTLILRGANKQLTLPTRRSAQCQKKTLTPEVLLTCHTDFTTFLFQWPLKSNTATPMPSSMNKGTSATIAMS